MDNLRVTEAAQFGFHAVDKENLYEVRAGVPVQRAADELSVLLDTIQKLAADIVADNDEHKVEKAFAIGILADMAQALLSSVRDSLTA
jgi:hypothetical protein